MLAFQESGNGTPLILLHGWGLHGGVWQSILPELEKHFHCYTVDMLGHGQSQSGEETFDLYGMCHALHQLVTEIDSKEIVLLGWSLGGLVAMDYVCHFPSAIKKLVLVCSNASFCKQQDWPNAMDESVLDGFAQQLDQDYKKTVDKFMALQMFGADDYKNSLKRLKHSVSSRSEPSIKALRNGLHVLKTTDLRAKLGNMRQPVLMITGEHDRLMPYIAAEDMQRLFKNAQSHMIKGAGHAPFISHADLFIKIIKVFSKE